MITTSTGAKKLESSDNWREIFPNPGTSAAGAHNATVDAQDRIQAEVAPIINGKRCSVGAASGEYVLLRNSTIAGKTDGAYKATKAIPADTDLDSTYLGSPITGGMVNELNNNLTALGTPVSWTPSMSGATLTNMGSNYVKIGKLVYLFCAFSCDIAVGDSGAFDILIPSAVAPGNDFQTVFVPACINIGKKLYGRLHNNGLHIFNLSGQTLEAGAIYQMFVVYTIA